MVAIPTTSNELAEVLADDKRRQEIFANADSTAEFLNAYTKATDKSGTVAQQITEQVQAGIVDFFKANGVAGRPDVAAVQKNSVDLPIRGTGAVKNAAYNPKAPGKAVQDVGFEGMGEFLQTINVRNRAGFNASKLQKLIDIQNAYSSSDPASAGFLIPEDIRSEIMQVSLESAVVRPRATVITMGSQSTSLPYVDQTTHSGSVFGGMVFYWTPESGTLVTSEAKFGRVKLEANKLTGAATVPNELMADAPALSSWFNMAAPQGLAFYEDNAFLNGDGGNEPLGVYNSPALITVTKETGQAAASLVVENVLKMYARMLPSSLNRAVWVINQTVLPQLLTLSIAVGTGGAPVNLININSTPTMTMLGRPVIVTEKNPALGSAGDVAFVDFGYYLLGDRQAISVESSEHVRFATDETMVRIIERVDGRPWVQSAITPLNGDTVSPFVVLGARA